MALTAGEVVAAVAEDHVEAIRAVATGEDVEVVAVVQEVVVAVEIGIMEEVKEVMVEGIKEDGVVMDPGKTRIKVCDKI